MIKLEQVLIIEPANELRFIGPFNNVVTSELRLANKTDNRVAFKVKTTAPKRYCVRPNSGLIEPNSQTAVSVMLQPFAYNPDEKNNHKFMVQSLIAPPGNFEHETLWKDATPNQLMDSKLKCVFELPPENQEITVQNNFDNLSARSNEDNVKLTPTKVSVTSAAVLDKSVPLEGARSVTYDDKKQVGGVVDEEVRRVQVECSQLTAEIQRLQEDNNKLRSEGVRLRSFASDQSSSTGTLPASSLGPIHQTGTSQQFAVEQANVLGNMPPIVYLIAMLILGLIVGKFVL